MANTAQAKKRVRQADKHRAHNQSRRAEMRTYIKKVIKMVEESNLENLMTSYQQASSMLDRLARRNTIHPNKAARHKSRLCKLIRTRQPSA